MTRARREPPTRREKLLRTKLRDLQTELETAKESAAPGVVKENERLREAHIAATRTVRAIAYKLGLAGESTLQDTLVEMEQLVQRQADLMGDLDRAKAELVICRRQLAAVGPVEIPADLVVIGRERFGGARLALARLPGDTVRFSVLVSGGRLDDSLQAREAGRRLVAYASVLELAERVARGGG